MTTESAEVEHIKEKVAFIKRLHDAVENGEDVTLWGQDYVALRADSDVSSILDKYYNDRKRHEDILKTINAEYSSILTVKNG